MKTFKQVVAKMIATNNRVPIERRVTIGLIGITFYVLVLYLTQCVVVAGLLVAMYNIMDQMTIDVWEAEDWPYMLGFFTWYTILYTAIATIFI